MNCDQALTLIAAQIDQEIELADRDLLSAHLRECAACAATAEGWQSQDADLRQVFAPRRRAAAAVADRVIARLDAGPLSDRAISFRRFAWAAAAAAVLAGIAFLLPRWLRSPSSTPEMARQQGEDNKNLLLASTGLGAYTAMPRSAPPAAPPLAIGASIQTKSGERRRFTLPDGSVLYSNQNTKASLETERRLVLSAGEVFVEVAPRYDGKDRVPFVVRTPQREITALGTKFDVRADEAKTGVVVTQGKVKVSGMDELVLAGQQFLTELGKLAPAPRAAHVLDWTKELMTAAESPLVPASKHDGGALIAVDPNGQEAKLSLRKYHIDVHIEDGFARTTIDQTYFNHTYGRLEGTFYFPLPPDASLSRLAMYVDGHLMEGGMAERDYARQVFESIMYTQRDPALLEWLDGSTFKMRVFPLEGRQEKRIILSYVQKLQPSYGRTSYRFPSGHSLELVRDWSFHARVKDGAKTAWASSHPLNETREGADLVLNFKTQHVKADRDVVLDLTESPNQAISTARFSSAIHEGAKYLMLRFQPVLQGQGQRQRRDWVFLFESSGDRDPVLARVQVDVIRTLLANAEHDDSFTILTAGTFVRPFSAEPQVGTIATPDNVKAAVERLEHTRLVGALDLGRALTAAAEAVKTRDNPVLVHVGSGIAAMGERRQEELLKRLPDHVPYVGVGVGKRWSRALMKSAAERSGGYFTQINPDEPIAWRAFELFSTLNAPRLLNIKVVDNAEKAVFLNYASSLAQGEELCAIARVEPAETALPESVTISGLVDGKPLQQIVPVQQVAPRADYLPRTWAKLEIDRLLAEDAKKHKDRIVALSKAMYVMTPFTSLLVLESEAMYAQYKVDRGRKDHWAMYDCPDKIPVVYEPGEGVTPAKPGEPLQKPPAKQVLQTLLVRVPVRFLNWPHAQNQASGQVVTTLQIYNGSYAVPIQDRLGDLALGENGRDNLELEGLTNFSILPIDNFGVPELATATEAFNNPKEKERKLPERFMAGLTPAGGSAAFNRLKDSALKRLGRTVSDVTPQNLLLGNTRNWNEHWGSRDSAAVLSLAFSPDGKSPVAFPGQLIDGSAVRLWEDAGIVPANMYGDGIATHLFAQVDFDGAINTNGELLDFGYRSGARPVSSPYLNWKLEDDGRRKASLAAQRSKSRVASPISWPSRTQLIAEFISVCRSGRLLYQRPTFSGDERVYTDLVAYAPGMRNHQADILAAVEAEAVPNPRGAPGTIDPAARRLIDKARAADWQTLTVAGSHLTVTFDGSGRYTYQRTLPIGLREQVVCDGKSLWHLYPDLGIGARRTVSRFHRVAFSKLVPGALPPAEDLAHGADLTCVNENTVAITPRKADAAKDSADQPAVTWCIHLVFAADGPLAESRVVEVPSGKILSRVTFDANGTVQLLDKDDKVLAKNQLTLKPSAAPDLKPATDNLVVLPLPLRTREAARQLWKIEPNQAYENLEAEAALTLLASEYASQNGAEAQQIFGRRFQVRGIRKLGFYTLLAACGVNVDAEQQYLNVLAEHPHEPLAEYLAFHSNPDFRRHANRGEISGPRDGFLQRLAAFRVLYAYWQSDRAGKADAKERERVLDFIDRNKDTVLGWTMLNLVQERAAKDPAFQRDLAKSWQLFEKSPGLAYLARYERARNLLNNGQAPEAQELFLKLYRDTVTEGSLPVIDSSFRQALGDGSESGPWVTLIEWTAQRLLENKQRLALIALAAQCWQLGDPKTTDMLLAAALDKLPAGEESLTTKLACIELRIQTQQYVRADTLLEELLADPTNAKDASLWRIGMTIASHRKLPARTLACLEKALEIEYRHLPAVIDLQAVRTDYGSLLSQYQQVVDARSTLQLPPPADLAAKVVLAADRWRSLDREAGPACTAAARTLQALGAADLAWEFLTTPIGLQPAEASPWLTLAQAQRGQGDVDLADRAYAAAFEAEPTNAQILWDRVQNLQQAGKQAEALPLLRQLAQGDWQPRFSNLKEQARWAISGR